MDELEIEQRYRKIVADKGFKSQIEFERNITLINLTMLRTEEVHHFKLREDYQILEFSINEVLAKLDSKDVAEKLRSKQLMIDEHMVKLIDFIKTQPKLFPPIIGNMNSNIIIYDGKHRLGLLKHLNFEKIPFLVKKESVSKVKAILS